MWADTVLIVSADNGGIEPGGFNYPLRGEKATLWDGGMRAVGFIASPRLLRGGFEYRGLVHVSDWYPTLMALGGGDPSTRDYLDGHNLWAAVTGNTTSPTTELLHNIDVFGGLGEHGVGNAAIRMGSLKLIVGTPGAGIYHVRRYLTSLHTLLSAWPQQRNNNNTNNTTNNNNNNNTNNIDASICVLVSMCITSAASSGLSQQFSTSTIPTT